MTSIHKIYAQNALKIWYMCINNIFSPKNWKNCLGQKYWMGKNKSPLNRKRRLIFPISIFPMLLWRCLIKRFDWFPWLLKMFLSHPLHCNVLDKIIIDWGKISRQLGKIVFWFFFTLCYNIQWKRFYTVKTCCKGVRFTIYAPS